MTRIEQHSGVHGDDFAERLLAWFDQHGRHDLPWQHPRTPYRVWLSEVMLQQTQVRVAIPYFQRFVASLPNLAALAAAPVDTVLALWSGLGYYSRARNLHATAGICMQQHACELPRDLDALIALPGIGRSTAAAILSQAWGDRFAILDGNVKRVLARHQGIEGWPGKPKVEKLLWQVAGSHLPHERLADYTQAQMDFGATLCTRQRPACEPCPLRSDCVAWQTGRVAELPTRKPGKTLPERTAIVLLLVDAQGRILLQRRPPTGIWASLWSLPQAATPADASDWLDSHLTGGCAAGGFNDADALDGIVHTFSHFRLTMQPLQLLGVAMKPGVRDNDDLRWFNAAELGDVGIPAPVRTLLLSRFSTDHSDASSALTPHKANQR